MKIQYDVDENLWPNPQDRVDYCRPTLVFFLLFSYLIFLSKVFEKPVELIISSIIFTFCVEP